MMRLVLGLLLCVACSNETGINPGDRSFEEPPGDLPPETDPPQTPLTPGGGVFVPPELDPPETEPPAPCSGAVTTQIFDVEFPATAGCDWADPGSLSPVDRLINARGRQVFTTPLATDDTVCDVRFEFSSDQGGVSFPFQYDDQVLFLMNDRVVFTSDDRLVDEFPVDGNGYPLFYWRGIMGMDMAFDDAVPWAIGSAYTLSLPGHNVAGNAVIAIDPVAIQDLVQSALIDGEVRLELVSLGDNDPSDCGHTGMSFSIEVDVDATN